MSSQHYSKNTGIIYKSEKFLNFHVDIYFYTLCTHSLIIIPPEVKETLVFIIRLRFPLGLDS